MRTTKPALALLALALLIASWALLTDGSTRAGYNSPPKVANISRPYTVTVDEDAGLFWIGLDPLFSDPDEDALDYYVKNQDGVWTSSYDDDTIVARIINNGTVNEPKNMMSVRVANDVSGEFVLWVNATDDHVKDKPLSAELDIHIMVGAVNDPPVIDRVGSYRIDAMTKVVDLDTEQGKKMYVQPYAHDVDGDVLVFSWDIGSVLKKAILNVTYDVDPATGQMWFRTSDADVPGFTTELRVADGSDQPATVSVRVFVDNVNDPPTISVPPRKATVEGESVTISPSASDPDTDSGDILTFSYNIGKLAAVAPPNAVTFDPNTGRLTVDAIDEEMNGVWDMTLTVTDLSMVSASGNCTVIIENLNDVPVANDIRANYIEKNLTVTFNTNTAKDEDASSLEYIWDFGDGSPLETGSERRMVTHVYTKAGTFTVTLKVTDGIAESEAKTLDIVLTAPDPVPDQDGDGMLDSWERRAGLDPEEPGDAQTDDDGDGLTNLQEFEYNKTQGGFLNPKNPDTDGDGHSDELELRSGSDPLDPASEPVPKYQAVRAVLVVLSIVLLCFAFMLLVAFVVIKIRNRPSGAFVAAPPPAQQYQGYIEQPLAQDSSPFLAGSNYIPAQTLPPQYQATLPPAQVPQPPVQIAPPVSMPPSLGPEPPIASASPVPESPPNQPVTDAIPVPPEGSFSIPPPPPPPTEEVLDAPRA